MLRQLILYSLSALTVFSQPHVHKAIKAGHKSTIESWLQNEDINVNECRGGCAFPQHFAVADGTALHWAVYYGQLEIAKLLLDNYGAGTNIANKYWYKDNIYIP